MTVLKMKRNEWYEAFMTGASLMACLGLMMTARNWWMFTWILLGIASIMALIGVIIKIGWHEFVALPQAMKMAIKDKRRKHGLRK